MGGIDYNGRPGFQRPRKLTEVSGLEQFQDKILENAFQQIDEREEATDQLFSDLAKTFLKGRALLNGLSKMDPAQFIPIEEFADSVRAAAKRLDKDGSQDGEIIRYNLYQKAIDLTLAKKWEIRGTVINMKIPASVSQQSAETSKQMSNSKGNNLIEELISQNGIISTIIGMLTISPFQTIIFQTLSVEEGAKGVQVAQIPAGLALFLELGIKAERIISMLKDTKLTTPLVELQIAELSKSESARAAALATVGVDYEEFKKSQEIQDCAAIMSYVSDYYKRYGGLDRPNGHLSLDHWIAYLQVAQNQQTIRGALNTAHVFSPKFQSIKEHFIKDEPATENIFKEEDKKHSKIFIQLASATRAIRENSNSIYDDIIAAFNTQLTDRELCCVSGDTRIQHFNGNNKISDLVGKSVEVWNGESWSKVVPFLAKKNQKLYRVHISDGSFLDCTDDHEWSIQKASIGAYLWKKKKTSELVPGYKVPKFEMDVSFTGKKLEYAYEYGYFLGDGFSISKNNYSIRAAIYLNKPELDLITNNCHVGYINGPYNVFSQGYNYPKWEWCTPELDKEKCKSLKGKNIKGLPNWLFELDKESILEFIGGYIDSDGNLSNNGYTDGYRIFGSEDKLRDLQLLLRRAGINFTTIREFDNKPTNKGPRTEPLWVCCVHSHNCQEIKTRLKTSNNFSPRFKPTWNSNTELIDKSVWQRITKIEELPGVHNTYCFNEPIRHMGVFGNVLTHQCLVEIFGAIGNPDVMYTIASLLRILATDLAGEIARLENIFSRYLANLAQDALFEIVADINKYYYKLVEKITKAFTVDFEGLEACGGMFSLGWAVIHAVEVIFRQVSGLIKELSSIIGDFGLDKPGSWEVSADRRELLGIARILEVLAARLDLANTCELDKVNRSVSDQISDSNSNIDQAIFTILGSIPPNLVVTEEEKAKYFPNQVNRKSERLKFTYGIVPEQNNNEASSTGCYTPNQRILINNLIKNLTEALKKSFNG